MFALIPEKVKDMLGLLALLGMVAGSIAINHWREKAGRTDAAEARAEAADRRAADTLAQWKEDARLQAEATKEYRDAISSLRNAAAARPAPVVRVCQPAPAAVPAAQAAALGTGAGSSPAGPLPPAAGPDIGPALYAAADSADELTEALRAIYRYLE